MVEEIEKTVRTARKVHRCNLCGENILPLEKYNYAKLKFDGELYPWKEHIRCSEVCREIYDLVDPDEGMTMDDFCEGCREVCGVFVCPDCESYDRECQDCEKDKCYCIDKLQELFKTKELYMAARRFEGREWKVRDRTLPEDRRRAAE